MRIGSRVFELLSDMLTTRRRTDGRPDERVDDLTTVYHIGFRKRAYKNVNERSENHLNKGIVRSSKMYD